MEDLFRMMLLRPAVAQDKRLPSIDLTQDSKYQGDLRAALRSADPREGVRTASRALVLLERFLGAPADNPYADKLSSLEVLLVALDDVEPDAVRKAVVQAFGRPVAELAADDRFLETMSRLRDSIVAIKLLQEEHSRPLEELVGQLRLMELIVRMDRDAMFPADADTLRLARFRTLQLPEEVGLGSTLSTRKATDDLKAKLKVDKEQREAEIASLLDRHAQVETALVELRKFDPSHLAATKQERIEPIPAPEHLTTEALAEEQARFRSQMRALVAKNAGGLDENAGGFEETNGVGAPTGLGSLVGTLLALGAPQIGQPGFTPAESLFTLAPAGIAALSRETQRALDARGIDLREMPVDGAANRLHDESAEIVSEIERVAGHPTEKVLKRIGNALVEITTPLTTGWGAIGTGGLIAAAYVKA